MCANDHVNDEGRRSPEDCHSITELRQEIDRLDKLLVGTLFRRQQYVERAAELKKHRNDVRDQARVAEVLAKVTAEAERVGLHTGLARAVWEVLVDRSIAIELVRFKNI